MRSFLTISLFSFCVLHAHITAAPERHELREVFQLMGEQNYDYALERIHHYLHHCKDQATQIHLRQEKAFLHLLMQSPQEALDNLNDIIARALYEDRKEYALTKALWMRLAISGWLHDSKAVLRDFELLKKHDKNLPKVEIHHDSVQVVSPTNSSLSFYLFARMLENFGYRSAWDHKVITVNAGYFEAQIYENANHQLVELAAACAFTDSPWGNAAWEYIGKTFAPQVHWKNEFPKYTDVTYRDVLKNLGR